ncbi:nitrilotriacetate monooxygenase component A [Cellulomonas chitinilytica]|uniref:Nitrilotriacetate monooxygenase component A n=1 Tax=Cellulomonas chitinilytica TaxID=398759 RepID=A0A919U1B5_9CELL|nr:NtaA/DmoA family FMN-dependent monooxygenase [Cellulomonas chitinilytica]GIG19989.1 nitrilotriacetate monooxygenase component A [Cellulomonas chitinilytica]
MSRRDDQLLLNVNLQGFGQRPAAWQVTDDAPDAQLTADFWVRVAQVAERGLLDAVFFADHPSISNPNPRPLGLVDPVVLASVITAQTERVGVIASVSTTYTHPVELAERLLSADELSGGRVGWNVVTTYAPSVARNFGLDANPSREERYRRADEVVRAVRSVWDAAAGDGTYRFDGTYVQVEGRTGLRPSRQRHPVLFQAGGSAQGRDLAARHADGVFAVQLTLDGAVRDYADLKAAAREAGRPGAPAITPGLSLVLGSTEEEAVRLFDDLESRVPPRYALGALSNVLAHDATTLDLDAPIPADVLDKPWDPSAHVTSAGYRTTFLEWIADRRHLTVREVVREFGGYGARIVIGTPEQVADDIEHWFESHAADGFNLMLDRYPQGLETFVDEVVPLLQKKGVYRYDYAGDTLRAHIGA